jgi:hypothetical protein
MTVTPGPGDPVVPDADEVVSDPPPAPPADVPPEPEAPAAPAEPETPVEPEAAAEPEAPAAPAEPETPVEPEVLAAPAEPETPVEPTAVATPRPVPSPMPRPIPKPPPRPVAPKPTVVPPVPDVVVEPPLQSDPTMWGRVAEDGTVYVRTADGERSVGSWPEGEHSDALNFYGRRFDALVVEVELLERRVRSGVARHDEAATAIKHTRSHVEDAQAVGDLAALVARLDALDETIAEQRNVRRAERAKVQEAARVEKETIAAEAEALAAGQDWRAGADRLRVLLDRWKTLPRLERKADDALWHRFSAARTTYTRRRRTHFAEQAGEREGAKERKQAILAEAESLSGSTDWASTAARLRVLMSDWKAAGPAPRTDEETLWRRFRAAQDAFFEARSNVFAERDRTELEHQEQKESLIAEAERLLPIKDLGAAKAALRGIQERWLAIGHVPRNAVSRLEAGLRKVEEAIRAGDQAEWSRTSPEALARAEATVNQLEKSVAQLEAQVAKATARGDAKEAASAQESLDARRSWLVEAQNTLADFRR